MDSTIVIAVVGIIGAIVGIVGTYLVQKTTLERQRRWALEDAEKKKESDREAEQKRIKRELLSKRLGILEEAIKIMINDTSTTLGIELGMPTFSDKAMRAERRKQLHDISEEAWATVLASGSKDLLENWRAISSVYWEQLETGTVHHESWDKAQKAYVDIVKITDQMRSQL
ncbi:MAG: hypothetical protein ISS51_03275 [Dehalococcoidales bacterium]|nr:hypothetical protein [Dehalococcoidales bacterium]